MEIQRYGQLLSELINGIDAGDFNDFQSIPEKYTYEHLMALFVMSGVLDNGEELFEQLYRLAMAYGENALQRKIQNGGKARIAFLSISAAEWPAEQVYRLLERDKRVECYVVVIPLTDRDFESRRDTYRQTYHFFEQNGYDVRRCYDEVSDTCEPWQAVGGIPDICIHLSSWHQCMPDAYRITSLPLSCINCYIPYGMYTADSTDGSYTRDYVYNKGFFNLMWKIYIDSVQNLEGYREYGLLRGMNVAYSGYAKMDRFYHLKEWKEEEIRRLWKLPEGKEADEMKRIIIAPHHSILGSAGIRFSTFSKNVYFLLYLAKKYRDQVSFILKPHPNLRVCAVEAKVFESYEAYDAYLRNWEALPNARVVQDSDYLDIFDTSDGMIMDSASFLGEYMYVNKPLLFLRRNGQAFSRLGKELLESCYLEQGEDYAAIEGFLQDVILNRNDVKKDIREKIWEKELDYMKVNKCTAGEYIYQDICRLLA